MNYTDRLIDIGPLEALVTGGEARALTIVLFHGYGADAGDLYPLSSYLKTPKDTKWVFPNGILEVPVGPSWMGRAWFPIDMVELERAMMSGTHRNFESIRPPGLDEARDKAYEMLKNLDAENLILGGFSQGAMLASDLLFTTDIEAKALVTLSGTLLDKSGWKRASSSRRGLPFFQSHGRMDPLLSYKAAEDLYAFYQDMGMVGEFLGFEGGHEIPAPILDRLNSFLQKSSQFSF